MLESLDVGDATRPRSWRPCSPSSAPRARSSLVDRLDNEKLALAARNHPAIKTVDALGVNVYDVVDRPFLVVSEQALGRLVEVLGA